VTPPVAKVQASPEVFELGSHGSWSCTKALPHLRIGAAIILANVGAKDMAEDWLEVLPSVLLPSDVLPILAAVGKV
jgi:hypothetical protein